MAFQRFHLLGAKPSTAKEVAVPTSASFKKVQIEVAKALDITTYKSVSFTTSEGDVLEKVRMLWSTRMPWLSLSMATPSANRKVLRRCLSSATTMRSTPTISTTTDVCSASMAT